MVGEEGRRAGYPPKVKVADCSPAVQRPVLEREYRGLVGQPCEDRDDSGFMPT